MKCSILLTFFISSYTIIQICAWKTVYPMKPVNLGFSRRPQRSLFGTSLADLELQELLTPLRGIQRPYVKQRAIRDLMTQLMANNQRVPMMSAPSYNRPTVQRDAVRPSFNQNIRGTNAQRYRQAMALPSSPVRHSIEHSRPQSTIIREPNLKKANVPSMLRPQSMFQQSPVRPPTIRKQPNNPQAFPVAQATRQHNAASLDSAFADILSSSSNSNIRNKKLPKKVEVVHHIPMSANPSNFRAPGPAVVYISKPKNNMQVPNSAFMRDVSLNPLLPPSQSELHRDIPFMMRDPDTVLPKGNNLNQDMRFLKNRPRNPQFSTSGSRPLRQHIQSPSVMPTTGLQEKFIKDSLQDHRNLKLTRVIQNPPQHQALRRPPPNTNIKPGISPSHSMSMSGSLDKVPRITRLRQELNAELEQLLKLVPQSQAIATKRPKLVTSQQIPHPFSIPSSQFGGSPGMNRHMKPTLAPEIPKNIPSGPAPTPAKSKLRFPSHEARKQFSKLQRLKPLPPVPDGLPMNHHRPVLSETSVDSEELSEILKNMGYSEGNKFVHNAAGVKPVELNIPGDSQDKQQTVIASPSKNEDLPPSHVENLPQPHNEDSRPSLNEDMAPSHGDYSHPSQNEYLSASQNEDIPPPPPGNKDLHSSDDNKLPLQHYEGFPPSESGYLHSSLQEDLPPSEIENLPPSPEELPPSQSKDLRPYESKDLSSSEIENLPPSNNEDLLPLSNTEETSTTFKTEDVAPSESGILSTPNTDDLASDSIDKAQMNNNKSLYNTKYGEKEELLPNSEHLNSNRSSPPKTYWDFRKLNTGVETPTLHSVETVSQITGVTRKEPVFIPGVNNYQGEESIASISVKEEFPEEEDVKIKYGAKHNIPKPNSGSLHDIYNMKIKEEKKDEMPIHIVRNFPQHLVPTEEETVSTPSYDNKFTPMVGSTVAHENKNAGRRPEIPGVPPRRVPNFVKPPKDRTRNMFPSLNIRERPAHIRTTEAPRYLVTNQNINNQFNQFQRTTPRYIITKTPHRHSFGQRNRPRNENSLVRKYIPPGRQQFNRDTPSFVRVGGSLNHPANNPSAYITPEAFNPNPTSPRHMNFRYNPFATEATPLHTQPGWKYDESRFAKPQRGEENRFKDYKPEIFTTTEIPDVVTTNSFEPFTAESQLENAQELENTASGFEFPQTPETITIPNKQFFRGPQHSIVFEDPTTNTFQESTTVYVPYNSVETTPSATTVTEKSNTDYFMPYNETGGVRKYSVHSQTKVINALHLANKVFGRRNHTLSKQMTTTKMPHVHKFTYTAVNTPSTNPPSYLSESTTEGKRLVFNFRTGTTQSLPPRTSSAVPKVIYNPTSRSKFPPKPTNQSLDLISVIKEDDKVISSPKNSSKTSLFQHIVFSQPNISSKHIHNQSVTTESNKDLYGILKPITKPYNESITTTEENDIKKLTTKAYKVRLGSTTMKSTSPLLAAFATEDSEVNEMTQSSDLDESQTDNYRKYLRITPTISDIEINVSREILTADTTESTVPYTFTSLAEIPTETTIKYGGLTNKLNLETNATTVPSVKETVTEPINQEQLIVDSLKSMKLKMQDMASKGLRHLMPLVMDLSSDVSISSDCTFSLLRWLRAVRTMEQWAVRMMDASSKMPEGILYGTFSTFGSYDECIGIKTPKANLQMPYSGQYCSINIQPILPPRERHFTIQNAFRKYPKLKQVFQEMNIEEDTMAYYYILKHRIGLCMPSTCSIEDLGNVTEKLAEQLKMKISVERCETSDKPSLTRGQVISMSSVFVAFGIVILATIIDVSIRVRSDHEMDIDEIIRKKNGLRQFSFVFSAYGNARKILNTSIPTTHLSSLHGIKFLSISWVMLGHVYYCKDYLTLAGLNKVRDLGSNLAFQVVLNSAFAADTFFFLSGLLVVYSTFLFLENNNGHFTIVGFYIRRYWRLTPAFLMISGVILLGPLAGSGPIWHETLHPFVSGCENYWWTNLFYFSNFMPTDKTCVPHGWFLSCDMQFYIVAPIIILALYRRPKLGILLIILGILSSMITTGFLTFLYNLPPVSLFSLPDPKDINEYLDTVGYKPYAHYASYCVGMATGFLLAAKQKISLSKCLQIFGWLISTIVCCLVIYGTWNWNSGELPSWPVSVAYATTSRFVWCLGVAWITVVCYAGHGGPINSILSWHGFIPLSRLSYLAYLIHPLLMYLYASYVRSPFYFSQYVVVYLYLGHLCVTFGLAFLFSLAFEVPFLNLEKIITKYLDKSKRKRRASFSNHHNNWQHPEHPELKDSVVLMRRRADKFLT